MIILKVLRQDPLNEIKPYYSTYKTNISTSLLMALREIRDTTDKSLAFRDYHCAKGICSSCTMRVNGKLHKACELILKPGEKYVVEPKNNAVIKDLIVKESSDING